MSKRFNKHQFLIVLLMVTICVATLAMGASRATIASVQDRTGPALGETIDLRSWRTRDGRTLAEVFKGHSLAMILLVNPSCGNCTSAKENFRTLREIVGQPGIPYYVLMIPASGDTPQKYFSYVDSLKLDVESFVWANTETKPPASLVTMAVPSHLLVTKEGLVVNKWPGTTPN